MKLLIVDDDPDTNSLVEAVCKHEGIEVLSFTNGLDALKFLDDHEVDVAVLDLEMPILDGLRLAKEIRKNEELRGKQPVKLVFATGHTIGDTIERVGDRVGVARRYMMHKPFDVSELMTELKKDFARHSS